MSLVIERHGHPQDERHQEHPNGSDPAYLWRLIQACSCPLQGHPEEERGRVATRAWLVARLERANAEDPEHSAGSGL